MFFKDKVHPREIIKWGIFAGLFEGLYIGLAAVINSYRGPIESLAGGWAGATTLVLLAFIVVSAIVTSVIVFAHPIYSVVHKNYKDALFTILVTVVTLIAVLVFVLFYYQKVFN